MLNIQSPAKHRLTWTREDNGTRRRHHTRRQQSRNVRKCKKYETCNFSPPPISKTVQPFSILISGFFSEETKPRDKLKTFRFFPEKVSANELWNFKWKLYAVIKICRTIHLYRVITYIFKLHIVKFCWNSWIGFWEICDWLTESWR